MQKEKCPNDQHDWYCRTRTGTLGEGTTELHLNSEQIKSVLQDSNQAQVICPGGIIVCGRCDDTIPPGQILSQPKFNFSELSERIIRDN